MEILRSLDQITNQLREIFIFDNDFNFEDFITKKIDLSEINKVNKKDCQDIDKKIENLSNFLFSTQKLHFCTIKFCENAFALKYAN